MKVHIEKNTVQETLVIPLYGRKMCSELYPNLYRDETAVRLMERVDYDFSRLAAGAKSTMQRFGFLEVAMRQSDLAWEVRDYLRTHPRAALVNLGCGLDGTGRACDLNDHAWMEKIDASGGAVFFAAGVFYYFLTPQVKALVCAMAEAFPGGKLVFDAANRKAVKLMLKTWLKDAEIKDVGAYFAVTDARRELSAWSDRLRVSSRGYMLGYNDLRNQNVRKFFRFLSKVGDGMMNMQIVRLDFAKENKKHE